MGARWSNELYLPDTKIGHRDNSQSNVGQGEMPLLCKRQYIYQFARIRQFVNKSNWLSYIDGLVQERRNSSVLTIDLRLSCTNPSI